jgi:hypothetical protein
MATLCSKGELLRGNWRGIVSFISAVSQCGISVTVLLLTVLNLKQDTLCYLTINPTDVTRCNSLVFISVLSLTLSVVAILIQCVTCHCLGSVQQCCELVFYGFNLALWVVAGLFVTPDVKDANAAQIPEEGSRNTARILVWVQVLLSVIVCVLATSKVIGALCWRPTVPEVKIEDPPLNYIEA